MSAFSSRSPIDETCLLLDSCLRSNKIIVTEEHLDGEWSDCVEVTSTESVSSALSRTKLADDVEEEMVVFDPNGPRAD